MNPALSVIFFTSASGAGYGVWIWLALLVLCGVPLERAHGLTTLALGTMLVTFGFLSSTWHLGQPQRAWRAVTQWKTSWLSREGVLALLAYLPALALAWALWRGDATLAQFSAIALIALAFATVACTAMIYASLKPIPAWRHPLVLPAYLLFALLSGGLLALALLPALRWQSFALIALAAIAIVLKAIYWRAIDIAPLTATRESATALTGFGTVKTFERPHTEANYLTREMGFVLARKHGRTLRMIAIALFGVAPIVCLSMIGVFATLAAPLIWLAALCTLTGVFVERWLFFAEAKHMVMLYY
jgi:DMSO reductase anchor subunit